MAKFKKGQRVELAANAEEGWEQEFGTVTTVEDQKKYPGIYIVKVDEKYKAHPGDDRIREVHESGLRPVGGGH
jgi:hypothetical protein